MNKKTKVKYWLLKFDPVLKNYFIAPSEIKGKLLIVPEYKFIRDYKRLMPKNENNK